MSSHISVLDLSPGQDSGLCQAAQGCVPNMYMSDAIVRAVRNLLFVDGRLRLDVPPGDHLSITDVPDRLSCAYVYDGYRNLVFWDGDEVLLAIPLLAEPNE